MNLLDIKMIKKLYKKISYIIIFWILLSQIIVIYTSFSIYAFNFSRIIFIKLNFFETSFKFSYISIIYLILIIVIILF